MIDHDAWPKVGGYITDAVIDGNPKVFARLRLGRWGEWIDDQGSTWDDEDLEAFNLPDGRRVTRDRWDEFTIASEAGLTPPPTVTYPLIRSPFV